MLLLLLIYFCLINDVYKRQRKRLVCIVILVVGYSTSLLSCCSADLAILVPQEEELYACQRGCRLFSICQFVGDSEDLNQTKAECESSKKNTALNSWYRYCSGFQLCTHMMTACLNNKRLMCVMPHHNLLLPSVTSTFLQPVMKLMSSPMSSMHATWAARTSSP